MKHQCTGISLNKTTVEGREEMVSAYIKRTGFFLFFPTSWWEEIRREHVANDIIINTERPIRNIVLNGQIIELRNKGLQKI